jgi:hypothetical protein
MSNKEVQDAIEKTYPLQPRESFESDAEFARWEEHTISLRSAARFGAGLAFEQLEEKQKEITRLKRLMKTSFYYLPDHKSVLKEWEEFKTKNNL